jgi:hypothetical protein
MEIEMQTVAINPKGVMQLAWDFYRRWGAEMSFGECLARAWFNAKYIRSNVVHQKQAKYFSNYDLLVGVPREVYVVAPL